MLFDYRFVVLLLAILPLSMVTAAAQSLRPEAGLGAARFWIAVVLVLLLLSAAFAVARSAASVVIVILLALPTVFLKFLALCSGTVTACHWSVSGGSASDLPRTTGYRDRLWQSV